MDKDTVTKVARLARLDLSETKKEELAPQMGGILQWMEQLAEVDTENVKPLANVTDMALVLRQDAITDGSIQKDVLANAPESLEGFYVVPKVVE